MNQQTKTILREGGKKCFQFLIRYRFAALVALILAYFLFWPKRAPHISTESTNPMPGQSAPALQLYDPDQNGADPKWSLPAELKSDRLQSLAAQVDKLIRDAEKGAQLNRTRKDLLPVLSSDGMRTLLWPGVKGGGFRDQSLPHDWYELVKGQYDAVEKGTQVLAETQDEITEEAVRARLGAIQAHLIGGKLLTGDVLCVKPVEGHVERRLGNLSKEVPQMINVLQRLADEFPEKMEGTIGSLTKQYPELFHEPQALGVRRLAYEQFEKDLGYGGFKSLRPGTTTIGSLMGRGLPGNIEWNNPYTKATRLHFTNEWLKIGPYPLTEAYADFHENGGLLRICLRFDRNHHEIYEAFKRERYNLQESTNQWTRGSTKLRAMCPSTHIYGAPVVAILAPIDRNASDGPAWDEIRIVAGDFLGSENVDDSQ